MRRSFPSPLTQLTVFLLASWAGAQVPTNGLVAYYPMNGDSADASGNGRNLTPVRAVLAPDRFGNPKGSYFFGPEQGMLQGSANVGISGNSPRTVSMWIYIDQTLDAPSGNLFGWGDWSADNTGYWDSSAAGGGFSLVYESWGQGPNRNQYRFAINASYRKWRWRFEQDLTLRTWYNVSVVYRGNLGSTSLYINGIEQEGAPDIDPRNGNAATTLNTGDSPLLINRLGAPNAGGILGRIDDFRIYNRALSAAEVQLLYTAAPPTIVTPPAPQALLVGQSLQLSVTANGPGPLSYQWRQDGTPIPGATSASYTASAVQPSSAGEYDVLVTNAEGTTQSAVAPVTVVARLPAGRTVTPGTPASLYVAAGAGRAALGYQWTRNGTPLPGATAAVLSIPAFTAADAASYACRLTTAGGLPYSTSPVNLILGPERSPNFALFANPNNYSRLYQRVLLLSGRTYTFQARVLSPQTLSLFASYPEFFNVGEDMAGKIAVTEAARLVNANGETQIRATFLALRDIESNLQLALWRQTECRITDIRLIDNTTNHDVVNNGRFDRGPELWSFGPSDYVTLGGLFLAGAPANTVVVERQRQVINPPEIFGVGPFFYQWLRDGVAVPGANLATLVIENARPSDSGSYSLIVQSNAGTQISPAARITVAPSSALANLSVRTTLGSGQTLIVGAVITGEAKSVLLRAAGPALNTFGLVGMADPRLELYAGSTPVSSNDNWPASLAATFTRVGAFGFEPGSLDAALAQTLSGAFTVQARGPGPGAILVEAYDAGVGTTSRLVNLSARNQVGSGADILIAGFALTGSGTKQVLIRAIGPGLAAFGVGGVLADPRLTLFSGAGVPLAANDNWGTPVGSAAAVAQTTFTQVGAFPLDNGSRDAALLITLNAGASYTVQVAGVNNTTGEAMIEVYEVF